MKKRIVLLIAIMLCTIVTAQVYPELVEVKGGTFVMGDRLGTGEIDERPAHEVTLTDYYIGTTEVTVEQYNMYCDAMGIEMPKKPEGGWKNDAPIVNVNWDDAINYCKWLSLELGRPIVLPTTAQWEFAARGGNKSKGYKYSGSDDMDVVGWHQGNSKNRKYAHPVAKKTPNELGLFDMNGNVWEWCSDKFEKEYYLNSPKFNPKNAGKEDSPIAIRGGCWFYPEYFNRFENRGSSVSFRRKTIGFRVASF